MKLKFIIGVFALVAALGFTACGDYDSNPTSGNDTTTPDNGDKNKKDDGQLEAGCNFAKEDNVWKYKYSSWGYIDVYTWIDESTVDFKSYMNAYHLEDDDTTFTDVNRDEFFDKVMGECQSYQEM